MHKIFRYECRRLLGNKLFWCLLVILLWYCWQTLTGEVILGLNNTAPFSAISFRYYLFQALPFLCIGELFFVTFFTSKQERNVATVTAATPVNPHAYAAVRCGAVLLGTALMVVCVLLMAMAFYLSFFHWSNFASLIQPTLFTLAPSLLFCLLTGWLLGRIHAALPYSVMVLWLILYWILLPHFLHVTA